MFNNYPPRIRGRVGNFMEDEEDTGKFGFEISLWDFTGTKQIGDPFGFGPFDTEKEAHEKMKEIARVAVTAIESRGDPSAALSKSYVDMKNGGVLRDWDEN